MRILIVLGVICLGAELLLAVGETYQPLNVKTGLWETTWTSSLSGRPPIPANMVESMTPEQRERFEAAMNKMVSQAPKTRTAKSCLTEEKLKKDPFNEENKSCTETILASSGSRMDIREVCSGGAVKNDVTVHIEAIDSEHVSAKVVSNMSGGGNTMNMNGTFTSKWLGAACGDTK
jgi:hypothetical protein